MTCFSTGDFVSSWLSGLEYYDSVTYDHSLRTAAAFVKFARFAGVLTTDRTLRHSALLHDIGKIAVPLPVIQKAGPLDEEERVEVEKHPRIAHTWMSVLRCPEETSMISLMHHERWDGTGYPNGLKEYDIPRLVRLFSVVDVWDAMTHDRSYRTALPEEGVLRYLRDMSGKQFDPESVAVFLAWRRPCGDVPVFVSYPSFALQLRCSEETIC
ncbi:MAG TPA: HD domain-containing phosphohydrolase [Anaerolineales bacterium]|nr:HD domain-containing phosphohydrolase [Anaerolineales bacterium]